MTTELTTRPADPEPKMLVALAPSDVPAAQAELKLWCDQKIAALGTRRSDLLDSVQVARTNNWQVNTLNRHVKEAEAEINYYTKIRDAVDAGFLIVPNFSRGTVLAVKVEEDSDPAYQREEGGRHNLRAAHADITQGSGEGQYVSAAHKTKAVSMYSPTKENQNRHVMGHQVTGYRDPVFPVTAVKPIVLEATARAMALKIFDQIDVIGVKDRKTDPVVVGRIYRPKGYRPRWGQMNGHISFFIAWWFNTDSF